MCSFGYYHYMFVQLHCRNLHVWSILIQFHYTCHEYMSAVIHDSTTTCGVSNYCVVLKYIVGSPYLYTNLKLHVHVAILTWYTRHH